MPCFYLNPEQDDYNKSNLEQAWELSGGSEDQLLSTMMQISQVIAKQFKEN